MPQAQLQRLHFISFRNFSSPVRIYTLAHRRSRNWLVADNFRRSGANALAQFHRLLLDEGRVTLDLWFGDINELTSQLDDSLNQKVDAWFLDGFAPAKNPDMWTQNLFNAMARLARPGGTLATFTSAGFVRPRFADADSRCKNVRALGANGKCFAG